MKTPDIYKEYRKLSKIFLKLLLDKIDENKILVADYGGGDAALSKELIDMCSKRKIKIKVENIDIEPIGPKPKNLFIVKNDVLKYYAKNRYDYSVSRFLTHYFTYSQQLKFFKNVYRNLKPGGYFLLINWTIDDPKNYKIKRLILDSIEFYKGIKRPIIPSSSKLLKLCRQAGFKIMTCKKYNYYLSLNDFYKNRFCLTKNQLKQIQEKISVKSHKQYQVGILLKK